MKLEPGGEVRFLIGAVLTVCGAWLFFDSVHLMTGRGGLVSNAIGGRRGEGAMGETSSMGIVLVPLFAGVVALLFNVRQRWASGN